MDTDQSPHDHPAAQTAPRQRNSIHGGIVIGLVLALCALLYGLYLWSTSVTVEQPSTDFATRPTAEQNNEPESTTVEARTETLQAVSTSDEVDAISADLDATLFPDMSADFAAIEAELFETP
jgi:hypothetical protein